MEKKSIRDIVQEQFDKISDKSSFKDKKIKKEFFDNIEKENKDVKRSSIESTFSTVLKQHCRENKIDFNDFSSKPARRFSSNLDLTRTGKPVDVSDESNDKKDQDKKSKILMQNPNAKKDDTKPVEYPLESVAGSFNSFLKALVPNLDDLSEQERQDASACLNMAFGPILENSTKARAIFGGMGILGIYGGKLGKARKEKQQQKEAKQKAIEQKDSPKELFEISEKDQEQFAKDQEQFLNEQKQLYENKGIQI